MSEISGISIFCVLAVRTHTLTHTHRGQNPQTAPPSRASDSKPVGGAPLPPTPISKYFGAYGMLFQIQYQTVSFDDPGAFGRNAKYYKAIDPPLKCERYPANLRNLIEHVGIGVLNSQLWPCWPPAQRIRAPIPCLVSFAPFSF